MVGNVKFVWNIPNALSIFRLVLLPVFAVLILVVERDAELPLWSFGVLVLSGVSTRESLRTYAYRPSIVLDGVGDIAAMARAEKK